jgi:hypothetical protein
VEEALQFPEANDVKEAGSVRYAINVDLHDI